MKNKFQKGDIVEFRTLKQIERSFRYRNDIETFKCDYKNPKYSFFRDLMGTKGTVIAASILESKDIRVKFDGKKIPITLFVFELQLCMSTINLKGVYNEPFENS